MWLHTQSLRVSCRKHNQVTWSLTCSKCQIQRESSPASVCRQSPPPLWEVHTFSEEFSSLKKRENFKQIHRNLSRGLFRVLYNTAAHNSSMSPSCGDKSKVQFTHVSLSRTSLRESLCPLSVPNIHSGSWTIEIININVHYQMKKKLETFTFFLQWNSSLSLIFF